VITIGDPVMKTPEQPAALRRREWIIVGAALVAVGLGAFILLRPEADGPSAPRARTGTSELVGSPKLAGGALRATAPGAETGPAKADPAVCQACEEKNRGGACEKEMGCENLSGEDKTLCENLLSCLRKHPSCHGTDPALCYCGSAQGVECAQAPKGPCIEEALAAAKTSDPTEGGIRFYKLEYPSGRASQVIACDLTACKDHCAPQSM
jgi:hypothetical protein